jgi:hypothetical protein
MMIGYDIYDCFTMEHFRMRQRMTLTTKICCSRLYICKRILKTQQKNYLFYPKMWVMKRGRKGP